MSSLLPLELPRITHILKQRLELGAPFVEVARRFAQRPGSVALLSGGNNESARYSVLGIDPLLTVRAKHDISILQCGDRKQRVEAAPLRVLQELVDHFGQHLPRPPEDHEDLPLRAGFLGYFSYDLKDTLERLPQTARDDLALPDLYLVVPRLLLIQERGAQHATLLASMPHDEPREVTWNHIDEFWRALEGPPPQLEAHPLTTELRSGFDKNAYLAAVERIREYIAAGDVYQVNLSQRFEAPFEGQPFALFEELFAANPAPFFAYVNATDHHIVSTSPERFLQLHGGRVETRPIKGTRPRSADPVEDARLREELQTSEKDDAELSMIVDLLRNDIGKVCRPGSVQVLSHKRVEAYENVFHLVSDVEGTLDEDQGAVDLVRATFPGGSITGCPKIRAMEIIDELEPVRRHVYTGSIGYLGFEGTMDLSIAIRTATISQGRIVFSVGGGIVYDSDPKSEYEETLHKGRTLIRALQGPGNEAQR